MPQKLCVDFKKQHWRSPATKLEEQCTTKLQGWQEKLSLYTKSMVEKMILREQENVFLFEFGLIVLAVLNAYFDIIRAF